MGPRKKSSDNKNNPPSPANSTAGKSANQSKFDSAPDTEELVFAREYWTGDSRDGILENGDGYHYYRMTKSGRILEAYECYELEDGRECATPLPEMLNIHWINDLGFEDFEALDVIKELEFSRIKDIANGVDRT